MDTGLKEAFDGGAQRPDTPSNGLESSPDPGRTASSAAADSAPHFSFRDFSLINLHYY
jgi:hypothetical protein